MHIHTLSGLDPKQQQRSRNGNWFALEGTVLLSSARGHPPKRPGVKPASIEGPLHSSLMWNRARARTPAARRWCLWGGWGWVRVTDRCDGVFVHPKLLQPLNKQGVFSFLSSPEMRWARARSSWVEWRKKIRKRSSGPGKPVTSHRAAN